LHGLRHTKEGTKNRAGYWVVNARFAQKDGNPDVGESFGCFRRPVFYHLTLFSTTPALNSGVTGGTKSMKQQFTLNVSTRVQTGRSASRRLRRANSIPAILYGKHTSPEILAVDMPEFVRLLKAVAGRAVLIELLRKDKADKALSFLQEVQRDPMTDRFLHIDLQEVKADEKMEIRVQVRVVGDSYGVKNESGVLEIASHNLRIRCFPKDLPAVIEVDVTELKVGETIKIGELKAIAGVELLDSKGQPVVSCVEPVAEIVEEVVAAEVPAEGAVVEGVAADGAAATTVAGAAVAVAGAAGAVGAAKPAAVPATGDKKAAPGASAKGAPPAKAAAPATKK
jgi:large subunit ribosomal protein L25